MVKNVEPGFRRNAHDKYYTRSIEKFLTFSFVELLDFGLTEYDTKR